MKVALLISGYLRSYDINLKFIEDEIINKFNDVHVYLHVTNNESKEDKYINLINDEEAIKSFIKSLKPISTIIENNISYHTDSVVNNVVNQWNKLYKLNELKKIHENFIGEKYDLVIRYRPDLTINDRDIFKNLESGVISIPNDSKIDKCKLTNTDDKHICDALAFGDSISMDKYFNIHNHLLSLVNKHGPVSETILHRYLNSLDIKYKLTDINYGFTLSKCNVFAIAGDSGSGKSTLGEMLKGTFSDSFMLECDRYHRWERGHKNWNGFTHLNPKANYITKMNEDIFNLKVGKDIYQVDYDHKSGRFTEKQIINSSDNLIVCGLHSLYKDSIYDLKIFMNTDDALKKKWKIRRDVRDRGYSVQKVLDNIKKREKDFNEFIEPQKDNADLIVRFFSKDVIDLNEYNKPESLSLELTINNKFDITNVLDKIDELEIDYILDKTSTKSNKLIFNHHQNVVFFTNGNIPTTNTFYDYIVYLIFNIKLIK